MEAISRHETLSGSLLCGVTLSSILFVAMTGCTKPSAEKLAAPEQTGLLQSQPGTDEVSSDFVEVFTDQFGAQLKSESSQPKIVRTLFTDKYTWSLDLDKDQIVQFHNFYGYPQKTELSTSITKPLTFMDTYEDAEVYFDGNGAIHSVSFWSSRLSLPNHITIGSSLEQVKKFYPDGFFYPETSTSKEARSFHEKNYYFLRMSQFGGGKGIIFHFDGNGFTDKITYGGAAFAE